MEDLNERPIRVSKVTNVSAGVVDVPIGDNENYVNGGILSSPKLSWVSCGPRITTINNSDGSKRTGWTFGWALRDPSYRIVCVEELDIGNNTDPILIVATESETNNSSLCFYHSGSSRVLKSIHFNDKITSLAVVSKRNRPEENLSILLKNWNGILAVGLATGKVLLLDIWWKGLQNCIEDHHQKLYNEQRQSKVVEVTIQELIDEVECKTSNVRHGSATLALWLNEDSLKRGRSASQPGVDIILGRMPQEFLTVSAVKFFPQISTLAVGYNTSCFQLWDLSSMNILYTSAILETMLPVYSFSFLEPSDDPRFVCYLWTFHHSVDEDSIPFAGMYILNYHEKQANEYNKQNVYEGFTSCNIRYQLDLGAEMDGVVSGKILACQAIKQSSENKDDGTANLLMIAWQVWTSHQQTTYSRVTVFDVNQWYREYMPQSSDTDYSHFMTHFRLPATAPLDVHIVPGSVRQFQTLQPMDEHFYPSAISFNCVCLQEAQVLHCTHTGVQRECVNALREAGPSSLLLPSRLYNMCIQTGIRPVLTDPGLVSSPNSKEQRDFLLSIALEFDMVGFLRNCVRDWSDGSHAVAGCTLPSLLHWAHSRVQAFKMWLDKVCVPLFDFTGATLDSNDLSVFHHMICQLHRLRDLFKHVLDKYSNCILPGNFQMQHIAISLVRDFYKAVLWCVNNEVLPETNVGDAKSFLPYASDLITNAGIHRRGELHLLACGLNVAAPANSLLLIDALITEEGGGSRLTDQWEREGGSVTMGKYPPASVQSLLRTYLVKGIPEYIKHMIVTYFLHDLVFTLGPEKLSDSTRQQVLGYPKDCGLSESRHLIAKALWCLDHQKYKEGVDLLLDARVNTSDLQVYLHHTVLCLLISASEHKLALNYMNIRDPNLPNQQDIRIKMALLLSNNLIHEAFQFQRHHHSMKNELSQQFFKGCVEMRKLDVLFKLPMNAAEEHAFLVYLEKCTLPQADDFRVYYLITRSRYTEAIDLNERLRGSKASKLPLGYSALGPRQRNMFGARDETGAPAKTVFTTRDLIVNTLAKSLPSVTKELAEYCSKEKKYNWMQVTRPAPLSVEIHTDLSCERLPFYKATEAILLQTAVKKSREMWAASLGTPAAAAQKRKSCSELEQEPFLRTPRLSIVSPEAWRNETKRPRLEMTPETTRTVTTCKPVDMDLTSQDSVALQLLHTPLVARASKRQPTPHILGTPHSILKGSAANTPTTPARCDLATNRQIRFSLPEEKASSTTSSSMDEEESDQYSPKPSPRKPIHEMSSVQGRKGTPANPRNLTHSYSLRTAVTQLRFDDEETETVKPHQSATAATLLKNISAISEMSSDGSFFSLQSSTSKGSGSVKSGRMYKLSMGLEGNIVKDAGQFEETLVHEESSHSNDASVLESGKADISLGEINKTTLAVENHGSSTISEDKKTLQNASITFGKLYDQSSFKTSHKQSDSSENDPKSPENYKNVTVQFTHPSPFLNRDRGNLAISVNDNHLNSIHSTDGNFSEESEEESFKKPVLKWTKDKREENKESLELKICKIDKAGVEKHVATVSVSQKIPLYCSDAVTTTQEPRSEYLTSKQEKVSVEDTRNEAIPPRSEPSQNNTLESTSSILDEESFSEELQNNKDVDLFSSTWINTSKTNADISSPLQITKEDHQKLPKTRSSLSTTKIGEIPLHQVLDELVRKKKICSVVKESSLSSKPKVVEESSVLTVDSQTSVNKSHTAVESEVEKEGKADLWKEELEDDINLSYHESTYLVDHESTRCDKSETSSSQPTEERNAKEDKHEPFTKEKRFLTEDRVNVEDLEEPSILITSTTSLINQTFGIECDSIGDFELRMSEGESIYDAASQEEVEKEGESEECEPQVVCSATKVQKVAICTDEKTEVTVDFEVCEKVELPDISKEDLMDEAVQLPSISGSRPTHDEEIEVPVEDVELQPSYQTLTAVQYSEEQHEEYVEENDAEDDVDVETEDVDLYGDLEEEASPAPEGSDEDEVICLESDSSQEVSQSRQVLPESELRDESLDYEALEEEDHEEGYNDDDEDDYYDDHEDLRKEDETRSSFSDQKEDPSQFSSNESSSSSVPDSSENEASRGNRSWKNEIVREVDEVSKDASSIDTIESPPFEAIGPVSPSTCAKDEISIEHTQSSLTDNTNVENSSSNKLSTAPENLQSDILASKKNNESTSTAIILQSKKCNNEEIIAEIPDSVENTTVEEIKEVIQLGCTEVEVVQRNIEMIVEDTDTENTLTYKTPQATENYNVETFVSEHNFSNRESEEAAVVFEPSVSTNQSVEESEIMQHETSPDESGVKKIEEAVDLMKQALVKRDKQIETGSITDLKKRRVKRSNSIQNMSQSSKKRLRRRSLSHHDLTSIKIVDEKSSSSILLNEDKLIDVGLKRSISLENVLYFTHDNPKNDLSYSETTLNIAETVTPKSSESCTFGLVEESQTFNTEKQIDSLKIQRILKNHTTSLQDITEESWENCRNSIGRRSELRRSVSTSALDKQIDSNILLETSNIKSQPSSPTILLNPSEKRITREESEENSVALQQLNREMAEEEPLSEKDKLNNLEIEDQEEISHSDSKCPSPELKSNDCISTLEQSSPTFTQNPTVLDSPAGRTRRKRAQSESLTLDEETPKSPPRRRSSSLKIHDVEKRILSRKSKGYSHKPSFQPMEILNSDEDSFTEQSHNVGKKSLFRSSIHVDVSKEGQLSNEPSELKESEEISVSGSKTRTDADALSIVQEEISSNQRTERRGTSEPPTNQVVDKARFKKSTSYNKLECIHKLVLGRQSFRKSVVPKTLQNLEVVPSSDDEKSFHKDPEPSPIPSTSKTEMVEKIQKPIKRALKENMEVLDSPARRTRRSLSRLSETESLTPSIDSLAGKKKRNKKEIKMNETLQEHDDSASDISKTSSRLNTPTRRSSRIQSLSNTPTTPEVTAEEHLAQRRLTRKQLQKHLEMSRTESPMLEDVPEEDEKEEVLNVSTPKRPTSKRSTAKGSKRSKK